MLSLVICVVKIFEKFTVFQNKPDGSNAIGEFAEEARWNYPTLVVVLLISKIFFVLILIVTSTVSHISVSYISFKVRYVINIWCSRRD